MTRQEELQLEADRFLRLRGFAITTGKKLRSFRRKKIVGRVPKCFKSVAGQMSNVP